MWISVVIISVGLVVFLFKYVTRKKGPNPFGVDTREPVKPLVTDKKEKNKVLKQGFLASKVPENLDAIVIGSGIGGLGLAVLLAKVGKRVLVLEQHDRAGGCCHTFTEKGFEFDVGIHYIGDLLNHKPFRCMIDQLTNGQLQWVPLENPFDKVVLGPPENRRVYPIYSGQDRFLKELKRCFPGEEKAIDKYMELIMVLLAKRHRSDQLSSKHCRSKQPLFKHSLSSQLLSEIPLTRTAALLNTIDQTSRF